MDEYPVSKAWRGPRGRAVFRRNPRNPKESRRPSRGPFEAHPGAVALAGLGVTVGITVGGLLARDVAGTDSAGGLGQTAGVLGAAVIAVPLARISDRFGRRAGLTAGYGVAVAGAVVTVVAAALSSLPLLLV